MKCPSEKTQDTGRRTRDQSSFGFTLIEGMAAVTLLAFIGAGIWIVLERCLISATDSTQKMRAFETARDNMEKLLAGGSVGESTEYGISEKYPDVHWQTAVETFYLPANSKIWARATASADYTDSLGQTQTITLTNWLTELSDDQVNQLAQRKSLLEKKLGQYLIDSNELAAEYVGETVETLRVWVQNGMPTFEGAYIKPWLQLYLDKHGQPGDEDKQKLMTKYPELAAAAAKISPTDQTQSEETEQPADTEAETGNATNESATTSTSDDSSQKPNNTEQPVRNNFGDLFKQNK